MDEDGTWIRFLELGQSAKTSVWHIVAKKGGDVLGTISWYGSWRKYVLQARAAAVFEEDCLREIAAFVEKRTAEHRAKKKAG
jgi:hypothetical protein